MAFRNKQRRRSILKGSRNSIGVGATTELQVGDELQVPLDENDVEVGGTSDSTTTTLNFLPPAARKRVSFGNHQVKEFEVVRPCAESSPEGRAERVPLAVHRDFNRTCVEDFEMDITMGGGNLNTTFLKEDNQAGWNDQTVYEGDVSLSSTYTRHSTSSFVSRTTSGNENQPFKSLPQEDFIGNDDDMDISTDGNLNITCFEDEYGHERNFGNKTAYGGCVSFSTPFKHRPEVQKQLKQKPVHDQGQQAGHVLQERVDRIDTGGVPFQNLPQVPKGKEVVQVVQEQIALNHRDVTFEEEEDEIERNAFNRTKYGGDMPVAVNNSPHSTSVFQSLERDPYEKTMYGGDMPASNTFLHTFEVEGHSVPIQTVERPFYNSTTNKTDNSVPKGFYKKKGLVAPGPIAHGELLLTKVDKKELKNPFPVMMNDYRRKKKPVEERSKLTYGPFNSVKTPKRKHRDVVFSPLPDSPVKVQERVVKRKQIQRQSGCTQTSFMVHGLSSSVDAQTSPFVCERLLNTDAQTSPAFNQTQVEETGRKLIDATFQTSVGGVDEHVLQSTPTKLNMDSLLLEELPGNSQESTPQHGKEYSKSFANMVDELGKSSLSIMQTTISSPLCNPHSNDKQILLSKPRSPTLALPNLESFSLSDPQSNEEILQGNPQTPASEEMLSSGRHANEQAVQVKPQTPKSAVRKFDSMSPSAPQANEQTLQANLQTPASVVQKSDDMSSSGHHTNEQILQVNPLSNSISSSSPQANEQQVKPLTPKSDNISSSSSQANGQTFQLKPATPKLAMLKSDSITSSSPQANEQQVKPLTPKSDSISSFSSQANGQTFQLKPSTPKSAMQKSGSISSSSPQTFQLKPSTPKSAMQKSYTISPSVPQANGQTLQASPQTPTSSLNKTNNISGPHAKEQTLQSSWQTPTSVLQESINISSSRRHAKEPTLQVRAQSPTSTLLAKFNNMSSSGRHLNEQILQVKPTTPKSTLQNSSNISFSAPQANIQLFQAKPQSPSAALPKAGNISSLGPHINKPTAMPETSVFKPSPELMLFVTRTDELRKNGLRYGEYSWLILEEIVAIQPGHWEEFLFKHRHAFSEMYLKTIEIRRAREAAEGKYNR